MPLWPQWPKLTPDVKRVIALSVPGIVSGGIMQINLVIATMIATTIDGAVAYLYYADRLYQLPLGVIGVAIGVVLLPDLSRKLRAGNDAGALHSQNRALELSLFLTLPAAFALMAIPAPIIHTVFEHGAFSRSDTLGGGSRGAGLRRGTSGLFDDQGVSAGLLRPRRHQDADALCHRLGGASTSSQASCFRMWLGHVGIALATTIAAWVNAGLLGVTLSRRGLFTLDERLAAAAAAHCGLGLVMGALLLAGYLRAARKLCRGAGLHCGALGAAAARRGGHCELFRACPSHRRHAAWRNEVDAETLDDLRARVHVHE